MWTARLARGGVVLAAGFAVVAGLLACGDDDDNDDQPTAAAASGSPQGSPGARTPTPARPVTGLEGLREGSDEYWVRVFCIAAGQLSIAVAQVALVQQTPAATPTTFAEGQRALMRPLENYWKALDRSSPPPDIAEWNKAAVDRIKDALARAEKDDFSSPPPLPPFPASAQERIGKVFVNDAECKRVGLVRPEGQGN